MTQHGTVAGYLRHNRGKPDERDEWPKRACSACLRAMADYRKARRDDPKTGPVERLSGTATRLALKDLKENHPEEYKTLYDNHRREQMRLLADKKRETP